MYINNQGHMTKMAAMPIYAGCQLIPIFLLNSYILGPNPIFLSTSYIPISSPIF